jgi:hypothetical protein
MILCLAIWNTQVLTYLHGDCFVCTKLCFVPEMQISSHGTPWWLYLFASKFQNPRNKKLKETNKQFAYGTLLYGNPSRFRHGRRHFVAGNSAKSSSYIKVIRNVRRLGGETRQFRHNRESKRLTGNEILEKEGTGTQNKLVFPNQFWW